MCCTKNFTKSLLYYQQGSKSLREKRALCKWPEDIYKPEGQVGLSEIKSINDPDKK